MTGPLAELIGKLEAATEGNRELEEDIAAALAGATLEVQSDGRRAWHRDTHWVSIGPVLPWTRSLDAALTLVPEVFDWTVTRRTRYPYRGQFNYEGTVWVAKTEGFSHSAPLAICIAALRARAASEAQPQETDYGR